MAKLLFFNIPVYGHVNPTLPVVTELVQRGHHVVYYNSDTFEQAFKGTGAEFRSYPNSSTSEDDLAKPEQVLNGRQVARQGAGVVLADTPPYGHLDASVLRRNVDIILADPTYRLNAERLSRSFHEGGGYQQAATTITSGLD